MGRQLAGTVYVTDPNGAQARFGPGDDVPGWAQAAITNPRAWLDAADEGEDVTGVVESGTGQVTDEVTGPAVPAGDSGGADYETLTVAELRAEVKARNAGRDPGGRVSGDGNKADLIEALQADDEAQ